MALLGCRGIPARYGGFETFAAEISRWLVARGIEVTVFCEAVSSDVPDEIDGVRLEYVAPGARGAAGTLLYDLKCLWRARRGFDVVYMLGYGASFACFLPRLSGSEVWINMDGLEWRRAKWIWPARLWLKAMESLSGWTANRLVFDNRALAEEVTARRRPWADWTVLEYGAPLVEDPDPAPLAKLGLEPGGYDLVVCRAEPENHLLESIRAHSRVGCTRQLVVVANTDGDTAYCREVRRWTSDHLRLTGPIYDRAVLDSLRAYSHAYLHGHSVGGTNPSLVEAMGSGALVVAHDNPFNREVLADAGLYFRDESDLQATLEELEGLTPDRLRAYGDAARARVRDHYRWDDVADRYAAELRAALGSLVEEAAA